MEIVRLDEIWHFYLEANDNREVKDRRNNDVLRVWYHAEAWLELIRLVAHDRW